MEYSFNKNNNSIHLSISGKFTFTDYDKFSEMLNLILEEKVAVLDLGKLEFVDSAALGMLMILGEETNKKSINLSVGNANGQVKKMFEITKFQEILKMN